jgi:hypothetical protein
MNTSEKLKTLILAGIILSTSLFVASCIPPYWDTSDTWFPFRSPFFGFPFGILGLAVYFLPIIIAAVRHTKSIVGIILLNVLAGWTFIGWIIALVWSLTGTKQRT